jgi:hypothetical protein
MTTRRDMELSAARYLHRQDFTQTDISAALGVVTARLGQDLRIPENSVVLEIPAEEWTNPYPLPAELRQISHIEYNASGSAFTIRSAGREFMNRYAGAGGLPAFYWIQSGGLWIRPNSAQDFTVYGWSEPDAIGLDGEATNAVLSAYPDVYRYGMLAELALITQDLELVQTYLQLFEQRIRQCNVQAENLRAGSGLAIRGN